MMFFPNVSHILSERARINGNKLALLDWDEDRWYRFCELEERALKAASFLKHLGFKKGDRLSILSRNRLLYIDLFFACAKIGAVFTPINWRLAPPEVGYIVSDSEPSLVVFEREFEGLVRGVKVKCMEVEEFQNKYLDFPPLDREEDVSPEDPQVIFYTSGTTGKPKGAVLPHRMIMWNSFNTILSWGLTSQDIAPVLTPLFHSGGFNVLLIPIIHVGGRLILTRTFDPQKTLDMVERERVTILFMVPTMFRMLTEVEDFDGRDLSSIRFCISGGAPCPLDLMELFRKKGISFRQGFGMTEVGVNCFTMDDEEAVKKAGSVGRPIMHTRAKVVDEEGRELPPGEIGELIISGPHLMLGYWRNKEETEKTLKNGWIYTGDLAKVDRDGFFYIVGRKKDMIISGGENVYLAEVEMVIAQHPKVKDVAVIGVPHEMWGEVGRAVVVLKEGEEATEEEILKFCEGKLARYKIPKSVVFAKEIPRNPYGKVLRDEVKRMFGK